MRNINYFILLALAVIIIPACETYPDWEEYVEYSETYPVSGEYIVYDYDAETGDTLRSDDGVVYGSYPLYIYNKSYNPTGDSIWIDNRTGHPGGALVEYPYKFKIKAKADLSNLSFDVEKAGDITGTNINPTDSAIRVTITNSMIKDYDPGDITSAKPDSIYFEFSYYDKYGDLEKTIITAGHRKTGWENPNYDDPM